jgi:cobalamin biosynthesis protein CobT
VRWWQSKDAHKLREKLRDLALGSRGPNRDIQELNEDEEEEDDDDDDDEDEEGGAGRPGDGEETSGADSDDGLADMDRLVRIDFALWSLVPRWR